MMYKEYLINQIKSESISKSERITLLGEFYVANLNLIHIMAKEQSISTADFYDYMQLGYDALQVAVRVYEPESRYSFLSFFRRAFKHEIYKFNLEFHNPVRIKSPSYVKDFNMTFISYGSAVDEECLNSTDEYQLWADTCLEVENSLLSKLLHDELQACLSSFQLLVITEIFWNNRTKRQISCRYHKSLGSIRYAYSSAMKKLRKNATLRRVALDMFGIGH